MKKRSYSPIMANDYYLSTRTVKSITKSRRSSATDEKPSSRRSSLATAISLLSIPGFIDNVTPLVSTLDVHTIYKSRLSKSNRKLNYFFGESTPLDVCISEVRREGLKAILESKVPLCYFLFYLLEEYNSENLFFFLQVDHFEKTSGKQQEVIAHDIYNRFISNKSEFEINLDERVRRRISLSDIHSGMFSEAKACVYLFLDTSFVRFQYTDVFEDMVVHCGEYRVCYSDRRTKKAVDYLLSYHHNKKKHFQHYHFLVQPIIHEFIQSRFETNKAVQKMLLPKHHQKKK